MALRFDASTPDGASIPASEYDFSFTDTWGVFGFVKVLSSPGDEGTLIAKYDQDDNLARQFILRVTADANYPSTASLAVQLVNDVFQYGLGIAGRNPVQRSVAIGRARRHHPRSK